MEILIDIALCAAGCIVGEREEAGRAVVGGARPQLRFVRRKESRMARVFGEEAKYTKKETFCAALASFSEILLGFLPLKLEMTSLLC